MLFRSQQLVEAQREGSRAIVAAVSAGFDRLTALVESGQQRAAASHERDAETRVQTLEAVRAVAGLSGEVQALSEDVRTFHSAVTVRLDNAQVEREKLHERVEEVAGEVTKVRERVEGEDPVTGTAATVREVTKAVTKTSPGALTTIGVVLVIVALIAAMAYVMGEAVRPTGSKPAGLLGPGDAAPTEDWQRTWVPEPG